MAIDLTALKLRLQITSFSNEFGSVVTRTRSWRPIWASFSKSSISRLIFFTPSWIRIVLKSGDRAAAERYLKQSAEFEHLRVRAGTNHLGQPDASACTIGGKTPCGLWYPANSAARCFWMKRISHGPFDPHRRSIGPELLEQFDLLIAGQGYENRSEAFQDLNPRTTRISRQSLRPTWTSWEPLLWSTI